SPADTLRLIEIEFPRQARLYFHHVGFERGVSFMKSRDLVLRGFAFQQEGQWVSVCIDFDLAAQGDTFHESHEKLQAMVEDYVADALIGPDRDFAGQLLSRKSPLRLRAYYHFIVTLQRLGLYRLRRVLADAVPLVPSRHSPA
ncbi:hypothetical protein, partial [Acidithiobacillus sp.]|uniref:hypothetical protein n=1 Tax=Acidithiobacillus sp. TaxID=1872118 RepID=UPI00260C52E7